MKRSLAVISYALLGLLSLSSCGGDDESMAACDAAWDKSCADKEWADCINAAPDPCTATCR